MQALHLGNLSDKLTKFGEWRELVISMFLLIVSYSDPHFGWAQFGNTFKYCRRYRIFLFEFVVLFSVSKET